MQQIATLLLFLIIVLVNGSCGWHSRNAKEILPKIKRISFNSDDLNSPLSRAIYNHLRINNIKLIKLDSFNQKSPSLRITNSSLRKDAVSIFPDGHTAEYQITLSVDSLVSVPDMSTYSINTKVHRSFFNNPQALLAKDIEQQVLINEMYDEVAEQLIYKLLSMRLISKGINTKNNVKQQTPKNISVAPGK